jgi:selenocysteine-specific elongation factor
VITIGGGMVLDPLARRATKKDVGRAAYLATMETGDAQEIAQRMTERSALGATLAEIVARTGWLETDVRKTAAALAGKKAVQLVSNDPLILMSGTAFEEISEKLRTRVEAFHKENPLAPGMPREELRASLRRGARLETFRAALDTLVQNKKLAVQGDLVKRPGAEVTLTLEEARAKDQIEKAFADAGLAVPAVKEVLGQLAVESRRAEKILQILLRERVLVRVSPELVFHSSALGKLPELLRAYKKAKGERIGVPSFKEITGITRKYAIPLLEYLDRQRMTRRVGDERVIL